MLSDQIFVVLLFDVLLLCHGMLTVHKLVVRVPKENDIGLIFDLTVCNDPSDKKEMLNFIVRSDGSCTLNVTKDITLCGFSRIYGGDFGSIDAGKCETVSLIWPTVSLYNRVGFCPFVITSSSANNEETHLRKLLYFDTRFETLDPDRRSLRKHKDYQDCDNWDKDYLHNCTPVNCEERYFGKRTFYNRRTEQCEPVPACVGPGIYYNIYANECIDKNHFITEDELDDIKQGKYDDNYLELEPTTNYCDESHCPAPQEPKQQKNGGKKAKVKKEIASGGKRSIDDFSCCLGNDPVTDELREKKMTESSLIMQWLSPLKLASSWSIWSSPVASEAAGGGGGTTDASTKQGGAKANQNEKADDNVGPGDRKQTTPGAQNKDNPKKTSSNWMWELLAGLAIVLITLAVYLVICFVIFLIVTWIIHRSTFQESRTSVTQNLTPRESDSRFSIMTKSSLLSQR